MYDIETLQTIDYHQSMLHDAYRTQMFLHAILSTVKKGDVVLDLGCGTGILSYFACIAGAKRVYAIEQGPIIELAERICQENGFQDRVIFIQDWSSNVDLPEKVDVIVTETIGNLGFEEGILGWVMDARERLLSERGSIIPGRIEMEMVPIESLDDYSLLDSWLGDLYSIDFSAVRLMNANTLHWTKLSQEMFIADPACMAKVELPKILNGNISAHRSFVCKRDGMVHGLGGWFSAVLAPGVRLGNAPPLKAKSWSHGFLPLVHPLRVKSGERLHVRIQLENNAAQWKWHAHLEVPGDDHKDSSKEVDPFFQNTNQGHLLNSSNGSRLNHNPELNQYGETDLFILKMMDGNHSIKEITRRVIEEFPTYFADHKSALAHVNAMVGDYGRWEMNNRDT